MTLGQVKWIWNLEKSRFLPPCLSVCVCERERDLDIGKYTFRTFSPKAYLASISEHDGACTQEKALDWGHEVLCSLCSQSYQHNRSNQKQFIKSCTMCFLAMCLAITSFVFKKKKLKCLNRSKSFSNLTDIPTLISWNTVQWHICC